MINNIELSQDIQKRLFTISQRIGRKKDELIQETIINYLENLEDIKEA